MEGGTTGPADAIAAEWLRNVGATVMGRHMFGGGDVARQYLTAGLIDEMEIHVDPVLLGAGARLFDNTDARQTAYECVRVVSSPTVSHFKYRLKR